jgi:hypothetical protein
MPLKTHKRSHKRSQRSRKTSKTTLRRRYRKKGGSDSQAIIIPTNAIRVSDGGVQSQHVITGTGTI